jgi:hypothetical protein
MAGYIRQSSFSDGDTITAALFNNEFNQALNAFSNTGGHKHDGTAAEGPVIGLIGDAGETAPNNKVLIDTTNNFIEFYVQVSSSPVQQLYIADGAIIPVTDSDVDLGTTSLRFKDTYTDTVTTTGNVSVGGNLTVTGTTTFNGGTITMGDAATDNVVFGADVDSNIIPDDDDTYDLGSASQQWRNIFIDGTANIDSLVADTADINAGTIDGTVIGGSSAAAITGTTINGTAITGTSFVIGSANIAEAELETIDGVTAGTVAASKAVVVDSDKDIGSFRNITLTGELDAATLDISGNGDVAGTLAVSGGSTNGVLLSQGAISIKNGGAKSYIDLYCESSNAHYTRIEAAAHGAYSGNVTATLPVTTGTLAITSEIPTTEEIQDIVGAMTTSNTETNITVTYQDADGTIDFVVDAAQPNVTSLGTLTSLTVDDVIINGATIGHTSDTDLITVASGVVTVAGELDATSLDISGDADIDGTLEADAITIGGVTLAETISDTVGAMVTSNTESGITVAYQDADNTLDFTIGTLNQNTTGSAATLTTPRAIAVAGDVTGTANFDGSAGISITTTLATDAIVTANITNANVTVAKMAANSIDSDQYVDGSIDTAHIADSQITVAKMAANSVDSDQYVDGSIDTAHIADSQVTVAKMAANSVDSDQYVDGSIDTAHYADNSITGAELADNIDIAGTFDVTGATTLDSTLVVAGIATASTSANITEGALVDGTTAWDAAAKANATLVLEENTTISAPSNPVAGAIISIEVAQHATSGPYTLAWNTVFEFAASTAPTMTATDAKTDIFSFRYNGSVWQEIGRSQNMAQT